MIVSGSFWNVLLLAPLLTVIGFYRRRKKAHGTYLSVDMSASMSVHISRGDEKEKIDTDRHPQVSSDSRLNFFS